jgi:hypothetical protein
MTRRAAECLEPLAMQHSWSTKFTGEWGGGKAGGWDWVQATGDL